MANGADAENFVVLSKVRTGLKREFAFALKYQSQISDSLGRTRAKKAQAEGFANGCPENSGNKRCKRSEDSNREELVEVVAESNQEAALNNRAATSEEDDGVKSDVVDVMSDDESKSRSFESVNESGIEAGVANSGSGEKKKSDILEVLSDDEQRSNVVESGCEEEFKDDAVKPSSEEPLKEEKLRKDDDKVHHGKGVEEEILFFGDDNSQDAVSDLLKGSTPSALTSKEKSMEKSVNENEVGGEANAGKEIMLDSDALSTTVPKKQLSNMPVQSVRKNFPIKLKDFLDMGILEGLPVKYIRGAKWKERGGTGLQGVIKGSGILCYCGVCEGKNVVTPTNFELHAGSANKRPPEYIHLENGKTLRDVMNVCKDAPLASLEGALQMVIGGSSVRKSKKCLNCRGLNYGDGAGKRKFLCDSCAELSEPQALPARATQVTGTDARSLVPVSAPKSSDTMPKGSSSRSKGQGRITRKDLRLHKLVFEEDILPDGTEVAYYVRGQKLLIGYKKGFGIFCTCCKHEISPSQFEAHAGWASRRKPYLHIYTSNGVSLHELSISLSRGRKFTATDNDDLCTICADGGDLLCCDGCPRSFHKECAFLPSVPTGTWYCKYCENLFQKERSVMHNANAVAAGRVAGVDPIEEITKRCIRIVKTPEAEDGGCALCREHDFSRSGFGPRTVILCDQCEKEYHVGCLKEHNLAELKQLPEGNWFCCGDCSNINSNMQKLVVHGGRSLPDFLLNQVKRKREEKGLQSTEDLDIRWRLLSGKTVADDTKMFFSKAVSIFHESFDPIVDSASGRDLIPAMVYGRSMRDRDFGGMHCAILTVNSSVVSAGTIRIFGQEMAELPVVATSSDYQGLGYFQALFSCLERLLGFLNVKNLVLPAADEVESIWTNKFGFKKMTQEEVDKYRRHYQMMAFQGTSWLHKSVPSCQDTATLNDV